jgi:hypothetical protein
MASATSNIFAPVKSRRSVVVSLVLLLLLSTGAMLLNAASLHDRLKVMRSAAVEGGAWHLADLDAAYRALVMAADDLSARPSDPLADQESAVARLQAASDRFSQHAATARLILPDPAAASGLGERLMALDAARSAVADHVAAITPADRARLPALLARLEAAAPIIRDITAASAAQAARARDAERSMLRAIWVQTIMASAALLGGGGLALWLWYGAARRMPHLPGLAGQVFDASSEAILIADADGRIMLTNPAAPRLFGRPGDGLTGLHIAALIALDAGDGPDLAALPPQMIGAGALRVTARRPNGPSFPAEISVTAQPGPDGRPILIAFIRDVTGVAAAEDQLRTDRETAERNAEAKSTCLSMMSHDMRTPLQGMIAALDLLDRAGMDQTERNLVQTARDCSLRALQQINDVLETTRLNWQRQEAPFDPKAIVSDILYELTPLAAAQNNQLNLRLDLGDRPLPSFTGEPAAFARAIYNLVGNAVKFTTNGRVTVALTFRETATGKFRLDVAVVDTGVGIALDKQDRMFKEFKMLNGDRAHQREGAGLGLIIASAAVRQMNGALGLKSRPGEGSTFSFSIDLATAAMSGAAPPASTPTADDPRDQPPVRHANILVVDDNAINLGLLAAVVRKLGHSADEATDGSMAVGLAAMRAYDVILMDVSMPVMDGYTASRIIRAGGPSSAAMIVAVTAYSDIEDSEDVRAAGIDAVLTKPATQAEIAAVLDGYFQQKTAPAGLPAAPSLAADPAGTEVQRALVSLSETLGGDNAIRLIKAGLTEVADLLNMLDADPDVDDQVAAAIHRVVGSTAVLGLSELSQALSAAEQAAHQRDRQQLLALRTTIKTNRDRISGALAAYIA